MYFRREKLQHLAQNSKFILKQATMPTNTPLMQPAWIPKNGPVTLEENCQAAMPRETWENLHSLMGITLTRRTQMFNRPQTMILHEIETLAKILEIEKVTTIDMIIDYHCGWDRVTLDEVNQWCHLQNRDVYMQFGPTDNQPDEE